MSGSVVGIDVGTSAIRAVEIEAGLRPTVLRLGQVATPAGSVRSGEVVDPERVADAMKRLLSSIGIGTRDARLVLNGSRTLVRPFSIPAVESEAIEAAVLEAVRDRMPLPIDDLYSGYSIDDSTSLATGETVYLGMFAAAHRRVTDRAVSSVDLADMAVTAVELAPFVLARVAAGASSAGRAEAVVSLGGGATTVVIHQGGVVHAAQTISIGGGDLTTRIAQRMSMSIEEAEHLKRHLTSAPPADTTDAQWAIGPLLGNLVSSIARVVNDANKQLPAPVEVVLLTGGGSRLHALGEQIELTLGISAKPLDPFVGLAIGNTGMSPAQITAISPLLASAVGAALGVVDPIAIDVLKADRRKATETGPGTQGSMESVSWGFDVDRQEAAAKGPDPSVPRPPYIDIERTLAQETADAARSLPAAVEPADAFDRSFAPAPAAPPPSAPGTSGSGSPASGSESVSSPESNASAPGATSYDGLTSGHGVATPEAVVSQRSPAEESSGNGSRPAASSGAGVTDHTATLGLDAAAVRAAAAGRLPEGYGKSTSKYTTPGDEPSSDGWPENGRWPGETEPFDSSGSADPGTMSQTDSGPDHEHHVVADHNGAGAIPNPGALVLTTASSSPSHPDAPPPQSSDISGLTPQGDQSVAIAPAEGHNGAADPPLQSLGAGAPNAAGTLAAGAAAGLGAAAVDAQPATPGLDGDFIEFGDGFSGLGVGSSDESSAFAALRASMNATGSHHIASNGGSTAIGNVPIGGGVREAPQVQGAHQRSHTPDRQARNGASMGQAHLSVPTMVGRAVRRRWRALVAFMLIAVVVLGLPIWFLSRRAADERDAIATLTQRRASLQNEVVASADAAPQEPTDDLLKEWAGRQVFIGQVAQAAADAMGDSATLESLDVVVDATQLDVNDPEQPRAGDAPRLVATVTAANEEQGTAWIDQLKDLGIVEGDPVVEAGSADGGDISLKVTIDLDTATVAERFGSKGGDQ